MGSNQKVRLLELYDGIVAHSDNYYDAFPFYAGEALTESVLRFLAKHPGQFRERWKKAKMLPIGDLSQLYAEEVASLCSNLGQSFKNSIKFYVDQIVPDKSLYRLTEGFTQTWIMIRIMCNDTVENRQKLIENLHNLMYAYAQPKRRSFFKWIRDENKAMKELEYRNVREKLSR